MMLKTMIPRIVIILALALSVLPFVEIWLQIPISEGQRSGMTLVINWLGIWVLIIVLKRLDKKNAYYKTIFWLTIVAFFVVSIIQQSIDPSRGIANGAILIIIILYGLVLILSISLLYTNFSAFGWANILLLFFQLVYRIILIRILSPEEIRIAFYIGSFIGLIPLIVLTVQFFQPIAAEQQTQDILHE